MENVSEINITIFHSFRVHLRTQFLDCCFMTDLNICAPVLYISTLVSTLKSLGPRRTSETILLSQTCPLLSPCNVQKSV